METETWIEIGIIAILVLSIAFFIQADRQAEEEWINYPKLYRDCAKKVSVEHSNYCAEIDSLECFERCLK